MSIIRRAARPADNFTVIANAALRDERLSYKARGLLAQLLSHEVGWRTTLDALAAAGPDGRAAVKSAVAELRRYGYLSIARERTPDGQLGGTIWDVTDSPMQTEETTPQVDNQPLDDDAPQVDYPPVEKSTPVKKNNLQEEQHHSHHTDSVGAVDKSNRMFKLTPNRTKALHDVLTQCGVSYAIPEWNAYIRTVDLPTGQELMRRWFGIREAMRHGEKNRREDLNELLAMAGVADVSDAAWLQMLASTGGDGTLRLDF